MLSEIVDGKVLDWRFKRRKVDTLFYIGDIFVGQIFKIGKSWSAVSRIPTTMGVIHGFRTRGDAARLLLKIRRINGNFK